MKDKNKQKSENKQRRAQRTRAKIKDVSDKLRMSVFKSAKHIYAQIIDDEVGKTLVSASDAEFKKGNKAKDKSIAWQVGELVGNKCKEKKIKSIVFDKGSYKYHGRIKELAEGARSTGLKF